MSVTIDEKAINIPSYTINSISFSTLSINIETKTIYLNCDLEVQEVVDVKVVPIYIYRNKFNNMIDIQKLNNIIEGLYGLSVSTTPPPISKYRYIPYAPI
jgi:hypothetical protein